MPTSDPRFWAVVDAYDRTADEELKTRRDVPDKPQIRPYNWRLIGVHYQFRNRPLRISLDFESAGERLGRPLSRLRGEALVPGIVLEWVQRSRSRGRLFAMLGKDANPEVGARAMQALIARTRHIVEHYL
ncbi:MAG: hypothetical protein Q8Q12_11775 [bacterium]|nr:hypothetical protein [bacterium]